MMNDNSRRNIIELPQITISGIGCVPKEAVRTKQSVFLCRIFGEATAAKTKPGRSGDPYTYLVGAFRAIRPPDATNLETQPAWYEAERLYLPVLLQEKIENQLALRRNNPVQFGYDIFAAPDSSATVGYHYTFEPILEASPADRFGGLDKLMVSREMPVTEPAPIPTTAAPAADPAPAAPAKTAKKKSAAPKKKK